MSGPADRFDGLPVDALARAWRVPAVEAWQRLGSTSDRARDLAGSGAARGTVVLADEQTAGRGRRGATWTSPPGAGLWMSLLLEPDDATLVLPLTVGAACAEAIEAAVGGVRVDVKWPNDLVVGGRKLGGILTEGSARAVVVGIGINLRTPDGGWPTGLVDVATALDAVSDRVPPRTDLAGEILRRILERADGERRRGDALDAVRSRDALRGRPVWSEQAGVGVARGIDDEGALIVERPDGSRVHVVSGSVRAQDRGAAPPEDLRGG